MRDWERRSMSLSVTSQRLDTTHGLPARRKFSGAPAGSRSPIVFSLPAVADGNQRRMFELNQSGLDPDLGFQKVLVTKQK